MEIASQMTKKMTARTLFSKIYFLIILLLLNLAAAACLPLNSGVKEKTGCNPTARAEELLARRKFTCTFCHTKTTTLCRQKQECCLALPDSETSQSAETAAAKQISTKQFVYDQMNVAVQAVAAGAVEMFPDTDSRVCLGCHDGLIALSCQCKTECLSQHQQDQ